MKRNLSALLIAASIIFSGVWIGNGKETKLHVSNNNSEVLTVKEASTYLNLNEDTIMRIIEQEEKILEETGTFSGMMLPYTKVYDQFLFSKNSLNKWVQEASETRTIYNEDGILN